MAEEEADYGLDDEQDEWRRGPVDIVVGADEDVLSLDGNEDEAKPSSPLQQMSASATGKSTGQAHETSQNIPTGPRRGSRGSVPTGPRNNGTRPVEETKGQLATNPDRTDGAVSKIASPPATDSDKALLPLLDGWEMATSRKTGKVFYYHANGQTVWERPTVENPPEKQNGSTKNEEQSLAKPAIAEPTPLAPAREEPIKKADVDVPTGPRAGGDARDVEKRVPAGPAANDPVASAYASRTAQQAKQNERPSVQGGAPSGPRDFQTRGYRRDMDRQGGPRSRPRSPSPRRDDPKRFRGPDGRMRSPPRLDTSRYARSPPRDAAPRTGPPQAPRDDRDRDFRPSVRAPLDREVSSQHGAGASSYAQNRPSPGPVRGPNTAPVANNRWGTRANDSAASTPTMGDRSGMPSGRSAPDTSRPFSRAVSPKPAASAAPTEDAAARRAALAKEKRKAEEVLKSLAEAEARLEREEEAEKALETQKAEQAKRDKELTAKRAEEEETKRREQRDGERRRTDEDRDRRRMDEDRARNNGRPGPGPGPGFNGPPRGGRSPMRARSPPPRMRSPMRPRSPPRGPPPPGRMRMDDMPLDRRPRERSPARWRSNGPPSPPRRLIATTGDSYRPNDRPMDAPLAPRPPFSNQGGRDRPRGNFDPAREGDAYRPDFNGPLPPRRNSPPPGMHGRPDDRPGRGGPGPFRPDRMDHRGPRDGRPLVDRLDPRGQTGRPFAEPMSDQGRRSDQRNRPRSPVPSRPQSTTAPRSLVERMSRPASDDRGDRGDAR